MYAIGSLHNILALLYSTILPQSDKVFHNAILQDPMIVFILGFLFLDLICFKVVFGNLLLTFCDFQVQAVKRGEQFNITGITYSLTQVCILCLQEFIALFAKFISLLLAYSRLLNVLFQGVVKNIVPAIASTNAIVAATCALETLKIATMCSTGMEVYMQYVTIH